MANHHFNRRQFWIFPQKCSNTGRINTEISVLILFTGTENSKLPVNCGERYGETSDLESMISRSRIISLFGDTIVNPTVADSRTIFILKHKLRRNCFGDEVSDKHRLCSFGAKSLPLVTWDSAQGRKSDFTLMHSNLLGYTRIRDIQLNLQL